MYIYIVDGAVHDSAHRPRPVEQRDPAPAKHRRGPHFAHNAQGERPDLSNNEIPRLPNTVEDIISLTMLKVPRQSVGGGKFIQKRVRTRFPLLKTTALRGK